ncbi:MAG TPA: hypothetical protein VJZ27_05615, partial [Aggregatilineales bacterium]|nr:hypothetical protein [Aggregatilineales bacterium]
PPVFVWRTDPGWQSIMRLIPLRNLTPGESTQFLSRRGIPHEQHKPVQDFAHGHPLAISLIVDLFAQREGFTFEPEESLDIIKTLLDNFVRKVPGPAHRAALEVCALVRLTSEESLAEMLEVPEADQLFEWVRELSFIEVNREGLFPHDVAREVLLKDLRWRNPTWYTELHRRARNYYINRFNQSRGQEQQRFLFDLIYLHRENPVVRPFFEWQPGGALVIDNLHQNDIQPIQEMVARHEGYESSRIASYWMARHPESVQVWREAGKPVGFLMMLPLNEVHQDIMIEDPGVQSTWEYLSIHAPLRRNETATLFRYWMAEDSYQAVSPIQSLIFVNVVRHYLSTPGLAFTFFPCADSEFWQDIFAYADLARLPTADFQVGDRHYGMYGHDWRVVPPVNW